MARRPLSLKALGIKVELPPKPLPEELPRLWLTPAEVRAEYGFTIRELRFMNAHGARVTIQQTGVKKYKISRQDLEALRR